jgi:hypothetical protein
MSKTAVSSAGDVNVRAASHLSKVPAIATDALTLNLTELSALVTSKTGTWARTVEDNTVDKSKHRIANRMTVPSLLPKFQVILSAFLAGWYCQK